MRMPVGARAMRLETRDDANGEVLFAGPRADGRRDGAGGDARDLPVQATTVQTVGAQPPGDGEHHLPVRYGRQERGVQPVRVHYNATRCGAARG